MYGYFHLIIEVVGINALHLLSETQQLFNK
ncbi:hypothetical protein XENE109146_18235 [Xenorhabdus nematophila]